MENQEQHTQKKVERCDEMVHDRLSNLPDPLIFRILSFMDTRYAVQTCVLSKKWRRYWAQVDGLNLNSGTFNEWMDFRKFVIRVFRYRNPFNLCRLRYCGRSSLLDRVLSYAKSRSLEELDLSVFLLDSLPQTLFECRALRTCKLSCCFELMPDSFPFASLTTLQLSEIRSLSPRHMDSCDLFSSCLNLENLIIMNFSLLFCDTFIISTPRLVKLVISNLDLYRYGNQQKLVISAPILRFFDFDGRHLPMFNMGKCSILERVNVHIKSTSSWIETDDWKEEHIKELIYIAEELYHAKSLKITASFSKGIMKNKIRTCQGKFVLCRNTHDAETEIIESKEEKLRKLPTSLDVRSWGSAKDLRRLVNAYEAELKRQKAELERQQEEFESQARRKAKLKEQAAELKRLLAGNEGVCLSEEQRRRAEELVREVESLQPSSSSG